MTRPNVSRIGNTVTLDDGTVLDAKDALAFADDIRRAAADILDAPLSARGDGRITKAALVTPAHLESLGLIHHADLKCSGCGAELATERAFAEHFTIAPADVRARLWNLGACPSSTRQN